MGKWGGSVPEGCATIVHLVQGLPLQIRGFDVDLKVVAVQTHAHASWGDAKRQEAFGYKCAGKNGGRGLRLMRWQGCVARDAVRRWRLPASLCSAVTVHDLPLWAEAEGGE